MRKFRVCFENNLARSISEVDASEEVKIDIDFPDGKCILHSITVRAHSEPEATKIAGDMAVFITRDH